MKTIFIFFVLVGLFIHSNGEVSLTFHSDNLLMQYGSAWMFNYNIGNYFNRYYQAGDWTPIWVFVDMSYATRQEDYGQGYYNPLTTSSLIVKS